MDITVHKTDAIKSTLNMHGLYPQSYLHSLMLPASPEETRYRTIMSVLLLIIPRKIYLVGIL